MTAEERKDGMGAEQQDAALANALDACEQYLEHHQRAEKLLKQGFLKLAMARKHLPAHALSELSYHETISAPTVVSMPKEDDGAWQLARLGIAEQSTVSEARATLKNRKKGTLQEGGVVDCKGGDEEARQAGDTILWFSSLPPNDLRQAQKFFASGLQTLLDAAASARKVQAAVK